jgi:ABC-2 type transport system ATP-binding protein
MPIVIETKGLTRTYQTYLKSEGVWNSVKGFWQRKYVSKVALSPTDLQIEGGQIIGLVGANGAGKTTLLKLLSGLIYPTGGSASILGYSPWDRKSEYLRRISILLGQKNQLWWDIPAADSFELLARIYDLDFTEAKGRVRKLAELLQCESLLQVQLRRLSLGERMKMEIIGSLLHKPNILFLDEPTIGLDIIAQTNIREFLADYVRTEKPTVILTSHYMDDISRLADRLLLISQGAIVYDGTVPSFVNQAEALQKITFKLATPAARRIELPTGLSIEAGGEIFSAEVPADAISVILQNVLRESHIEGLKIEEANFEDVIRKFLEKESRLRKDGGRLPAGV